MTGESESGTHQTEVLTRDVLGRRVKPWEPQSRRQELDGRYNTQTDIINQQNTRVKHLNSRNILATDFNVTVRLQLLWL
jgi:hypothetical protein